MDARQVTDLLSRAHTWVWRREDLLLSYRGFQLFPDRLIEDGDGVGLSTTLSLGLRCGAWSPSLDGDLDPLTGEW